MKPLIASLLLVLLVGTPVYALLGESEMVTKQRYGDPISVEMVPGYDKKAYYQSSVYTFSVLFKGGAAVVMNYQMRNKTPLSLRRIERLLHNSNVPPYPTTGQRTFWQIDGRNEESGKVKFVDKSLKLTATYFLYSKTLSIRPVNQ